MASDPTPSSAAIGRVDLNPFRVALGVVGYLGRLGLLATSALRSILLPVGPAPSFLGETSRQLDLLLVMGLPLVGLVHVGMGSFLSMQAYFGATFIDGIGPVTGVGLIRNLAPLLTGFILAGMISARYVAELGGRAGADSDESRRSSRADWRVVGPAGGGDDRRAGPVGLAMGVSWSGSRSAGWSANSMMGLTVPAFFRHVPRNALGPRDIVGSGR